MTPWTGLWIVLALAFLGALFVALERFVKFLDTTLNILKNFRELYQSPNRQPTLVKPSPEQLQKYGRSPIEDVAELESKLSVERRRLRIIERGIMYSWWILVLLGVSKLVISQFLPGREA